MAWNYLTVALRNIARHKLYSFINIAGLGVGLACVLFVILFVRYELSYDRWLPDSANLYRLEDTIYPPGGPPLNLPRSAVPVIEAMKEKISGVSAVSALMMETITVTAGDRQFSGMVDVVDPNFLQVVKLPLVAGDPATALSQPESLVLSQSTARKYFGDADPIGRTVTVGNAHCKDDDAACQRQAIPLKVTGVLRDVPGNSQLRIDVLMPNTSIADRMTRQAKENPTAYNAFGYVRLAPGTSPASVIAQMQPVLDDLLGGLLKKAGLNKRGSEIVSLRLTPFADVHLNSDNYNGEMTPSGSWVTVYGVAVIGLLILLVACFNFMNLATARALSRAREISLRKTVGASRRQLIFQFLGEAVLMAMLALVLALALVEMLLPLFDRFLGQPIAFHYLSGWPVLLAILAVAIVSGLLSGFYPALILSGFRPANVLRTNASSQAGSGRLRAALVVLQFSVSIGLGIAVLVVFSQINFARNIALGYRYDRVMVLEGDPTFSRQNFDSFVQSLKSHPGILDVALSSEVPFNNDLNISLAQRPGMPGNISLNRLSIDPAFARLYAIPLLAGRMLSPDRAEDVYVDDRDVPANEGHNVMLNAAAAARLGFTPQEAIGKIVTIDMYHVRVVGVLADTKFEGARAPAEAIVYYNDASENFILSIRIRGDNIAGATTFIDQTWHNFAPMTAPHRRFLSERFDALYSAEERQGLLFAIFVGLAIFIACLGLFGLAAVTAERRTKEIGIRKTFGAKNRDVLLLLLWQFSLPVVIANAIAWPLAWYYLHGWLQTFADRITLSPAYFLAAGLAALGIAWATIFSHAWRVARANPIHALRTE